MRESIELERVWPRWSAEVWDGVKGGALLPPRDTLPDPRWGDAGTSGKVGLATLVFTGGVEPDVSRTPALPPVPRLSSADLARLILATLRTQGSYDTTALANALRQPHRQVRAVLNVLRARGVVEFGSPYAAGSIMRGWRLAGRRDRP